MNESIQNSARARWLLVLPAAVGAFLASQVIGPIVTLLAPDFWSQLINSAAGGYCFVYVGAKTAPRETAAIAVVLAVIFAIFNAAVVTWAFVSHNSGSGLWLVVTSLIAVFVAVLACLQIHAEAAKSQNA